MKSLLAALFLAFILPVSAGENKNNHDWIPLFNGKDLSGWTIKITGHPLGENFAGTFRVEDGILKVSYDGYEKFDKRYGHLYTNIPYSRYLLRMEYRFTGKMMPDAPHYVNLNSGVMAHSQSPQSMGLDEEFPVSLGQLSFGHIALQAEGQPVWFRNIELKSLEKGAAAPLYPDSMAAGKHSPSGTVPHLPVRSRRQHPVRGVVVFCDTLDLSLHRRSDHRDPGHSFDGFEIGSDAQRGSPAMRAKRDARPSSARSWIEFRPAASRN